MTLNNQEPDFWPPAPLEARTPASSGSGGAGSCLTLFLMALSGAGGGAILLPALLFAAYLVLEALDPTGEAGSPVIIAFILVAAILLGAALGAIIGTAVWAIREARKR